MSKQLALISPSSTSIEQARARIDLAFVAALERVRDGFSPNTRKAYAQAWERWRAWCVHVATVDPDRYGKIEAVPVETLSLLAHLEDLRREGKSAGTIYLALSAICSLDRIARVTPNNPDPQSKRHQIEVQNWVKAFRREHGTAPQSQAPALSPDDVEALIRATQEPRKNAARTAHVPRACRDRALLLIGIYGGLRIGELVALRVEDVADTVSGLRVHVRRGKADQAGQGHYRGLLPQGAAHLCPVRAWHAWRACYGAEHGAPAFVEVDRRGRFSERPLGRRAAQRLIANLAAAAGVSASAHSLRATCVTRARSKGQDLDDIATHVGMRSLETVRRYTRRADVWERNPTGGLLE